MLILTILIILYIVFLPSEERVQILGEDPALRYGGSGGIPGAGPGVDGDVLLREHPGRMDYLAQREVEHAIPTVNLYTTTAATQLKALKALYVKHGWFDESQTNFTFSVQDIPQTNKVLLTFNRKEGEGRLVILLNGILIFQDELTAYNIDPIELPKDLLQQHNQVLFAVDGVSWKFWRTNEYRLQDVTVTADVTDASTTAAREVFLVTATERENAERAALRFFPDCVPGKVGALTVSMNSHPLFSGVPDCGVLRSMEISPAYFIAGENSLEFRTERGVYLIDQVSIRTELKSVTYPSYYFDVDAHVDTALRSGSRAVLSLDFIDDVNTKSAQVFVNGRAFAVSTRDREWWTTITQYLQPGTNAITIIPRSTLDIVNLEVVLE